MEYSRVNVCKIPPSFLIAMAENYMPTESEFVGLSALTQFLPDSLIFCSEN